MPSSSFISQIFDYHIDETESPKLKTKKSPSRLYRSVPRPAPAYYRFINAVRKCKYSEQYCAHKAAPVHKDAKWFNFEVKQIFTTKC